MSKTIPLASHIDSLLSKIASEKKAEELGTTALKSPENGDTKSIPEGSTYKDVTKNTDANVTTANLGDANKNPGGEHAGSVAPILTGDDASKEKVKSGKDVPETSGPKAEDQGAGKTAALANEILKGISELVKSASSKKAEEAAPVASEEKKKEMKDGAPVEKKEETKEAAEEIAKAASLVKEATDKFPAAFQGGYALAEKVASLLLKEADAADPAVTKVAAEAENDAIKVAEFLMGFAKTAGDEMAALLGAPAADPAGAVDPAAAMAGGADMGAPALDAGLGGEGGAPMGSPDEEQIVQALADALQAQGVTPEQLAEALAQEGAEAGGGEGGAPAADGGAAPFAGKETPAEEAAEAAAGGEGGKEKEETPAEEKKEEAKEASLRKTAGYKTANQLALKKIAALRAKGLLKKTK